MTFIVQLLDALHTKISHLVSLLSFSMGTRTTKGQIRILMTTTSREAMSPIKGKHILSVSKENVLAIEPIVISIMMYLN